MKHRIALIIAIAMLLSVAGQSIAMAATPNVEYTFERKLNEGSETVWDYTEKDLSFGTGTHLYEKALDDGHGDVLVMASASTNAITVLEPVIQWPASEIAYVSFDFMPKSTDYPIGVDFQGVNKNPCGITFNINGGMLIMGQGWLGSLMPVSVADIDKWHADKVYKPFNADEWINIKVVNNQKDKTMSFYVNDVLFKTEPTVLDNLNHMRIVQYNNNKNVQKGTEMLYIDNVKVGILSYEEKWSFANGLVMENFGICDSDGKMISEVQSDANVKTKLSNTSENPMKLLVFVSGYKDGVMESVDLKMCNIDAGGELAIDNANNTLSLDSEKEYDRIQLRILDGENGYPLIEACELIKE